MSTQELTAVIYTRVSSGEQAENGTSLDEQEISCRATAATIQARVIEHYQDAGVSGGLYEGRPGIQKALKDIESGKASVLIVYKVDRSGRDVDSIRNIAKRVTQVGGRLFFTDDGEVDYNGNGKTLFTMKAMFAEMERDAIRERTSKGRLRRVKEGIQTQRTPPYGYHVVTKMDIAIGAFEAGTGGTYHIVEEEAEIVRQIYTLYAGGESLRGIVNYLLSKRHLSPGGKEVWGKKAVTRIFENPVYKGKPVFGKSKEVVREERAAKGQSVYVREFLPEDQYIQLNDAPAIVDSEMWEICHKKLKTNKERLSGNARRKWVLSGILRCPDCGKAMAGITQYDKRRGYEYLYYRCGSADRVHKIKSIPGAWVNYVVRRAFVQLAEDRHTIIENLLQQDVANSFDADKVSRLASELSKLQEREEALTELQVEARIEGRDTAVYAHKLTDLNLQRRRLNEELEAERAKQNSVDDPFSACDEICKAAKFAVEVWDCDTRTVQEKYNIISAIFSKIELKQNDDESMAFIFHVNELPPHGSFVMGVRAKKTEVGVSSINFGDPIKIADTSGRVTKAVPVATAGANVRGLVGIAMQSMPSTAPTDTLIDVLVQPGIIVE